MPETSSPAAEGVHVLRKKGGRAAALLAVLAILSACSRATATDDRDVVAAGEHPFDLLAEATLTQEIALGGRDDPFRFETRGFPRFAFLADGGFVADVHEAAGASGVAHIDADGRILSWVATAAQNQSFLSRPRPDVQRGWANFGVVGDTVWFVARDRTSLILHTLDGEELGRRELPLDMREELELRAIAVHAEAGILAGGRGYVDSRPAHTPAARAMLGDVRLLVEGAGGVGVDTVFHSDDVRVGIGGTAFEPFGHPPVHDVSLTGERIVVADWDADRPGNLELRLLDLQSGTERRLSVALPFLELPDSVRTRVREAGVDALDRTISMAERVGETNTPFGPLEPGPQFLERMVRFPEYMPAVRRVLAGLDGTVWLQRSEIVPLYLAQSGRPQDGARGWVALDPQGVPLFRVTLPEGHVLRAARRDMIWTYDWTASQTGLNRWSLMPGSLEPGCEGG
jgi:hypothetical protein